MFNKCWSIRGGGTRKTGGRLEGDWRRVLGLFIVGSTFDICAIDDEDDRCTIDVR